MLTYISPTGPVDVAVVPVEARPAQELAARNHHSLPTRSEDHRLSIYSAMLAAADPAPGEAVAELVRVLRKIVDDWDGEPEDMLDAEAALARWEVSDAG